MELITASVLSRTSEIIAIAGKKQSILQPNNLKKIETAGPLKGQYPHPTLYTEQDVNDP
jgi:hypothetical protein